MLHISGKATSRSPLRDWIDSGSGGGMVGGVGQRVVVELWGCFDPVDMRNFH